MYFKIQIPYIFFICAQPILQLRFLLGYFAINYMPLFAVIARSNRYA